MTTDPITTDVDRIAAALPAYEIGGQLGKGGWGVVLAGRHRGLDRAVAIKQLPSTFAADPIVRRRFASEGRMLASLDHPHVVPVYDYVESDGLCLLVMELLPGGTVWSRFTGDGFDAPSAVAVALSCAAGLKAAHDRGILHRDVKPENLLFAASGALKVTDFGIAKVVGGDETMATKTGEVIGTPSYIAPEQARGGELTPATDVYALATMLYELLSGSLPFPAGTDALATLFMHAFDEPTPLGEVAPNIPEHLADVVMRGLATDPAQRYPTAEAFGIALAEASTEPWGPGWLAAQGIPVMGAETISAAATRTTAPVATTVAARSFAHGPTAPATPTVRPVPAERAQGARLADVAEADLIPVKEVVKLRSPRVPLLTAAGLTLIALAVAVIGLGSPSTGGTLPPGAATVGGVDPASGEKIEIDLNQPVVVSAAGPPSATTAELRLKALGATVAQQSAPLVPESGRSVATLPPLGGRYLLAGELTGELALTEAGVPPATSSFPVRTTQPAISTAAAVGVAALILFALAYLESFLRSLRHRRRRVSGGVGVPASAGLVAVGMVGAVWILLGKQPTIATLVTAAVFGALAGVAGAVGAWRIGQRRRYRRKAEIKSRAR
ncbi:protein kinase domain-containing protein [Nocardia sp. bgisy134]|uniref:serine/threonine-protein kinase n=1 Tax=unclassified Nocardia TaxID=2637762 RepID=UPI003D731CCF